LNETISTGTATSATAVRRRFSRAIATAMKRSVPVALRKISRPCRNRVWNAQVSVPARKMISPASVPWW
jgi:hypothetical protein